MATAPDFDKLRGRFPTIGHLRRHAQRHAAKFAFEYGDGGAAEDQGILRNWAAFDAIELISRCGILSEPPTTEVDLFGRRYSAPVGVAPMGAPGVVFPGADILLAKAAQQARIPYVLGLVGGATIEEIAELAPDVFWFQVFRCGNNNHKLAFDLMRRAHGAGAHALVITLDASFRAPRPREMTSGIGRYKVFRPNGRMIRDIMTSPSWLWAMLRNGPPRFANLKAYVGQRASLNELIEYAREEMGGPLCWDDVARYRDQWKGPAIAKGILHPADAQKALALGFDGIVVSNHGGRQLECLPAAIDCLPAIVNEVGKRMTVLIDSGLRSGTDVVRALALGASAAFAGKAFLWGLGALGAKGPAHVIDLFTEETRAALGQLGISNPAKAQSVIVRHVDAVKLPAKSG